MKSYIGATVVQAEPQDDPNWNAFNSESPEPALGYKVVDEDNYVSWSPKHVFERCYREVTEAEKALIFTEDDG